MKSKADPLNAAIDAAARVKKGLEKTRAERDEAIEALEECFSLALAWTDHYQRLHRRPEMHPRHAQILTRATKILGGVLPL